MGIRQFILQNFQNVSFSALGAVLGFSADWLCFSFYSLLAESAFHPASASRKIIFLSSPGSLMN